MRYRLQNTLFALRRYLPAPLRQRLSVPWLSPLERLVSPPIGLSVVCMAVKSAC